MAGAEHGAALRRGAGARARGSRRSAALAGAPRPRRAGRQTLLTFSQTALLPLAHDIVEGGGGYAMS